jgi:hypothetical protein
VGTIALLDTATRSWTENADPSFSFTASAGTNCYTIVTVFGVWKFGGGAAIDSLTVNGTGTTALTQIHKRMSSATEGLYVFAKKSIQSGARTFTLYGDGSFNGTVTVSNFSGVNQTTPFADSASAYYGSVGSGNQSLTVANASGNTLWDVGAAKNGAGTLSAQSGQTVCINQFEHTVGTPYMQSVGTNTAVLSATVWNINASDFLWIMALALKPG